MKTFFVSSTFRDMQEERDIIHRVVFPSLRSKLKKYGEIVEEVDLRWGVDTLNLSEEESGHMVIRVCIDAIDRCVPYFIVLLGERYGWIPDKEILGKMHDERLAKYQDEISITEMEIQYGVLKKIEDTDNCIFCFRNMSFIEHVPDVYKKDYVAESDKHQKKLQLLKQKICEIDGANILEYDAKWDEENSKVTGLEKFAEDLEALLSRLILKSGVQQIDVSPEEKITRNAEYLRKQYVQHYTNRHKLEELLPIAYTIKKSQWFVGTLGSGKTTFLSYAVTQAREKGLKCLLYYGGASGYEDVNVFLNWLVYELEKLCGKKARGLGKDRRNSFKKLRALSKYLEERVVVFVDAIDQMSPDTPWILAQLIQNVPNLQFMVSSVYTVSDCLGETDSGVFVCRKMGTLDLTDAETMILDVARRRGKRLDVTVVDKMLEKENITQPIYLSMLMQKLFMMDGIDFANAEKLGPGMEGLSRYMSKMIVEAGDTVDELALELLEKGCHCINQDVLSEYQKIDARKILGIMAVSPRGLSLRMLERLCPEVSLLHVQRLLYFMYDVFEETHDGHWIYRQQIYKQAVLNVVGKETLDAYRELLYQEMRTQEDASWEELFTLGRSLKKYDLELETIPEKTLWNYINCYRAEEYVVKLLEASAAEANVQIILKGLCMGELSLNETFEKWIKGIEVLAFENELTCFYYNGANAIYEKAKCNYKKVEQWRDLQYESFKKIVSPDEELILEMNRICSQGCGYSNLETAKKWFARIRELQSVNSMYTTLLAENEVWYWKVIQYKETKADDLVEWLQKYVDMQYKIYKVHDDLNLYEQENPEYTAECMRQAARFCENLSSIFGRTRKYGAAYPYAKICYQENKKQYQQNRTFETAEAFAMSAIRYTFSLKKEYKETYFKEAEQALQWLEQNYYCNLVGEDLNFLYLKYAEMEKSSQLQERAIAESIKLQNHSGDYSDWVMSDYKKYIEYEAAESEHIRFPQLKEAMEQVEKFALQQLEKWNDPYYEGVLFENAITGITLYTMQGQYDNAIKCLEQAEEYMASKAVQKKWGSWMAGNQLYLKASFLYYQMRDYEKLETYMNRWGPLLNNQEEIAKEVNRVHTANVWKGYFLHLQARTLWERTGDIAASTQLASERIRLLEPYQEKELLWPSYLLLGELYIAAGEKEKAADNLEKIVPKDESRLSRMMWMLDKKLTEYNICNYMIRARALVLYGELIGNVEALSDGVSMFSHILNVWTLDGNAEHRKQIGELLKSYFKKYEMVLDIDDRNMIAKTLLAWMNDIEQRRNLTKEEVWIKAKGLLYKNDINPEIYDEENEREYDWLVQYRECYPDLLDWNDLINRQLMLKTLSCCIKNQYDKACSVLKEILPGSCDAWNREKEILTALCESKKENGNDLPAYFMDLLTTYEETDKRKGRKSTLFQCFYIELLIGAGDCSNDKPDRYYRKAIKKLQSILKNKTQDKTNLLQKIYNLQLHCVNATRTGDDKQLYLEDLKNARDAYVQIAGDNKQDSLKLLAWDETLARIYEENASEEAWFYWERIGSLLIHHIVKKDLASEAELKEYLKLYDVLLQSVRKRQKVTLYQLHIIYEFPYEIFLHLYECTNDTVWLDKGLCAMQTYRDELQKIEVKGKEKTTLNEKLAESYLYDMDIYQIYLKYNPESEILEHFENRCREWVTLIPPYYENLIKAAQYAFRRFDKMLQSKNVCIRALVETTLLMNEASGNETFWVVQGLFEKYGTDMDHDTLKKLYHEEIEKRK